MDIFGIIYLLVVVPIAMAPTLIILLELEFGGKMLQPLKKDDPEQHYMLLAGLVVMWVAVFVFWIALPTIQ